MDAYYWVICGILVSYQTCAVSIKLVNAFYTTITTILNISINFFNQHALV